MSAPVARGACGIALGILLTAGLCVSMTATYSVAADYERTRHITHAAIVALCEEAPEHHMCAPPPGAHGWCEHDWQELAPLYCHGPQGQ